VTGDVHKVHNVVHNAVRAFRIFFEGKQLLIEVMFQSNKQNMNT
jgi:hypothetical protein